MRFRDPFRNFPNLDSSNYLDVNVRQFSNLLDMPQAFYDAVDILTDIRTVLLAARRAGILNQIGNATYYLQALQWLKMEAPINQIVGVTQIGGYGDINEAIAESFKSYAVQVRDSYLVPTNPYQQLQSALAISTSLVQQDIESIASRAEDDFRSDLKSSQDELATAINAQKQSFNEESASLLADHINRIQSEKESALSELKQAKALADWYEYYREKVSDYEQLLNGKKWGRIDLLGRLKNLRLQFKVRTGDIKYQWKQKDATSKSVVVYIFIGLLSFGGYLLTRGVVCLARFLRSLISYIFGKLISIKGQRGLWFFVLALVLIGQAVILSLIFLGKKPFGITLNSASSVFSTELIALKISVFLGFILVPSLGYAFANKNYRIYSNLVEQYRHRATVARTVQGILLEISQNDQNTDVRQNLAAVAAVAMFEHKTIGHLSKKDGDSLPTAELIKAVLGK